MTVKRTIERGGFNFVDMLFIAFAALIFMFVWFVPIGPSRVSRGTRVRCLSNIKQVALGFLLWANDSEKPFPMQLPVAEGGTKDERLKHDLVAQYRVICQELESPRILTCPADKTRKPAQSFTNLAARNLSYFLNLGATSNSNATDEIEVLLGDRQITLNRLPVRGYVEARYADAFSWTNWFHNSGNIALDDGSTIAASDSLLRDQLRRSEPSKIRLLVP